MKTGQNNTAVPAESFQSTKLFRKTYLVNTDNKQYSIFTRNYKH